MNISQMWDTLRHFILFYSILFYSILFYTNTSKPSKVATVASNHRESPPAIVCPFLLSYTETWCVTHNTKGPRRVARIIFCAQEMLSFFSPISWLVLTVAGAPVGSELHQVRASAREGLVVVDEAEMGAGLLAVFSRTWVGSWGGGGVEERWKSSWIWKIWNL